MLPQKSERILTRVLHDRVVLSQCFQVLSGSCAREIQQGANPQAAQAEAAPCHSFRPITVTKELLHLLAVVTTEISRIGEQNYLKESLRRHIHQLRGLGIRRLRWATETIFEIRCTSAFRTFWPKSVSR